MGCVGYAAVCDFRTHEVAGKVWLLMGGFGAAISAIRVSQGDLSPLTFAISVGITSLVAFAVGILGMWGGADVKAFICIALTLPDWPAFTPSLLNTPKLLPYLLIVIFTTCLLSLFATAPYCLARNLA